MKLSNIRCLVHNLNKLSFICVISTTLFTFTSQAKSNNIGDYIMYTNIENQSRALQVGNYFCTYKNQINGSLITLNLNKYCPKIMYYYKRDGLFYQSKG